MTPGYHLVSLDAKTGRPDPLFGKNGVVDLMDGLGYPMVPLAGDDSGPLIISDAAPMRKAKLGEKWDPVKKIGADGTIGIDPAAGQIAASSPPIVVGIENGAQQGLLGFDVGRGVGDRRVVVGGAEIERGNEGHRLPIA